MWCALLAGLCCPSTLDTTAAIIFVVVVPFVSFVSNRPNGLRLSVLCAAWLFAFATMLRCIPSVCAPRVDLPVIHQLAPGTFFPGGWDATTGRSSQATGAIALVHTAQVLGVLVCLVYLV